MVSKEELEAMKVADLKEECKNRGLAVTGKKDQLVARILEAESAAAGGDVVNGAEAVADPAPDGEELAAPEMAPEGAAAAAASGGGADGTGGSSKRAKIVFSPAADAGASAAPAPASKTITLVKQPSATVTKPAVTLAAGDLQTVAVLSDEERKKLRETKFAGPTDDSKLKFRAERFGLPSKELDEDKSLERKKRFGTLTEAEKAAEAAKAEARRRAELLPDEETRKKRIERFGSLTGTAAGGLKDTDKLKTRAERFGKSLTAVAVVAGDDDARKKARLARFGAAK